MDHNVKTKWVAALRSGRYEQGQSVLHRPETNEYCCLGVLCELAFIEGIVEAKIDGVSMLSAGMPATLYDGEGEMLPTSVCQWADLPSSPAIHDVAPMPRPLIDLNDVSQLNFGEIANLIEQYL